MYKTVLNTNVERLYVIYDQILKCLVNLLYIYIYFYIYKKYICVIYLYVFVYSYNSSGFRWF